MKRWIYIIVGIAAAAAFAVSAAPAFTADNGTLDMTIKVASPCVLVAPSSIELPGATFSATPDAPSKSVARNSHQVQNCAESAEPLFVRASEASGSLGAHWTLGTRPTLDINRYALDLGNQPLSISSQAVSSGSLAVGETRPFDVTLWMPLAGSAGSGQTMSMSLTYTVTF